MQANGHYRKGTVARYKAEGMASVHLISAHRMMSAPPNEEIRQYERQVALSQKQTCAPAADVCLVPKADIGILPSLTDEVPHSTIYSHNFPPSALRIFMDETLQASRFSVYDTRLS